MRPVDCGHQATVAELRRLVEALAAARTATARRELAVLISVVAVELADAQGRRP